MASHVLTLPRIADIGRGDVRELTVLNAAGLGLTALDDDLRCASLHALSLLSISFFILLYSRLLHTPVRARCGGVVLYAMLRNGGETCSA